MWLNSFVLLESFCFTDFKLKMQMMSLVSVHVGVFNFAPKPLKGCSNAENFIIFYKYSYEVDQLLLRLDYEEQWQCKLSQPQ